MLQRVVFDGWDFALLLPYVEGFNRVCKEMPFRGYFIREKGPYQRFWRFSRVVIDSHGEELRQRLQELAPDDIRETWDSFSAKIEAARGAPNPSAFVGSLQETIYPLNIGGVAIVGAYHPGVVSVAKNMGGRYLPSMRAWKVLRATAQTARNNLLTELSLRDDQVRIADGSWSIVEDALFEAQHDDDVHIRTANNAEPEKTQEDVDGDPDVFLAVTAPLAPTNLCAAEIEAHLQRYSLYDDYQPAGVRHLVTKNSALLADDMGLGKTRQAIVAAHILISYNEADKVVVICPAIALINWSREILMVDPTARISLSGWDESATWIVTSYEMLETLVPHAGRFKVMLVDEAHMLKEPDAQRTRLAFDMAAKVLYRYLLTGTPILNRECEIHTLLRLSGHPIGNIPLRQFEEQFAGDPAFRAELNKRISEWMLRRKKDQVLKTLKGKQRQLHYITVSDEKRALYDSIANNSSLLVLPKISLLRRTLEEIKVDAVVEMVSEMQADDKVIIFCEFVTTIAMLKARLEAQGLRVVTVDGTDSRTKRQRAQDAFQSDPEVRVFIGSGAARVAINLTAANYVIHASLPWTPALRDQAEDRAYRNGQTRLVVVKVPVVENTIDGDLLEMLHHKETIASDILDPDAAENAAVRELARKLAA